MEGGNLPSINTVRRFPVPPPSLQKVKSSVTSKKTLLKHDSKIILVCGASNRKDSRSCRDILIEYGQKQLTKYKFFQAEQVFNALGDIQDNDLLSLEGDFSKFCDCIIIILESPGAFAELGAFAMEDDIAKILFIINDDEFKNEKSFINRGPIAKTNKLSKFKPIISADYSKFLTSAGQIEETLKKGLPRVYGETFDLRNYAKFNKCEHKLKMLFLVDLISMFSPLSSSDLNFILQKIYGDNKNFNFGIDLSVLETLGLIYKKGELYIRTLKERDSFFKFYLNMEELRASVVNYYFKYFRQKSSLLAERSLL